MRVRRIAVIFTLIMLFFLFLFLGFFDRVSSQKRDIVYYNDQLYRISSEIEAGGDTADIENRYGCRIVYAKELDDPDLAELYANEAFVLDLMIGGEYAGKVAWLDKQEKRDSYRLDYLKSSLALWCVALIMGYAVLLIVYIFYIRPVDDLKKFSQELAKGNLDVPLPIKRTNLFGGFSEAFDIMREELKASQKRRMEAEIARRELVASLSHDVKTPVAVIDATCEVSAVKLKRRLQKLREADVPDPEAIAEVEDSMDKIEVISSKADTIQTLISELLHTNMDGSEQADVKPEEEYATLIEDYFVRIRNYGRIVLLNHIPKCLVYMDRKRMEQVIDNIVGNSVKYAGTQIEVSFDEVNDMMMAGGVTGSFIRIRISDHGPGVSEEDLPLIAQKYYRGSNAKELTGYGMGMYLVKQYMQKQGGDMEYYNDNGFTVVLMLKKV